MSRLRTMAKNPLVTAGVTSALCGVAVAVAANIPGDGVNEYQRTGRRPDDPESWSAWLALGLAVACLAWLWSLRAARPDSRNAQAGHQRRVRGVTSLVFAAGCVVAAVVVVLRMPTPGRSGGVDLSLPLMLLAFALAAVGALSPDGRLLATTVFVDAPRTLFIDGLRASTRVLVFDTVSGRLRADFAVPDTASVVAVGEGRVTIDLRPARDEPDAPERGTLGMFTFGGRRRGGSSWTRDADPPKSSRSAATC